MTRFGMGEEEMIRIAELMKAGIIDNKAVKEEVTRFRAQFQTVNYCHDAPVRGKISAAIN